MFVAKFEITTNESFRRSQSDNTLPLVGKVFAGAYNTSIISQAAARVEGIVPGELYICRNVPAVNRETGELLHTKEGAPIFNVEVVSKADALLVDDYVAKLGAGRQVKAQPTSRVHQEEPGNSTPEMQQVLNEEEVI